MKKRHLRVLNVVPVALILCLFAGCSGIQKIETAQLHTIDFSTVDDRRDLSVLAEMAEGKPLKEPVVMKLPKGFELPVQVILKTPLVKMDSKCGTMVFSQDLFLYLSQSSMLVSPDKINWADMSDFESVKKLFGWGDGNIAMGIGTGRDQGTLLGIKISADPVKGSRE